MIPPARRGGRPRDVNVREVLNGIFYVLWTGCQWSALPKDLPPKSTAHLLHAVGLGRHARAHPPRALCGGTRPGRARGEPIGGGDRQPERQGSAKRGASLDPQGFDAGKKVTGRKRHILVDTLGLLLSVIVHPADARIATAPASCFEPRAVRSPSSRPSSPTAATRGHAEDGGDVATTGCWKLEIVKRTDAHRFVALPKRWIVERTFAWISRNRRLARDFERYARIDPHQTDIASSSLDRRTFHIRYKQKMKYSLLG